MAVRYLLDTDIASYAINGRHAGLQEKFQRTRPGEIGVSVITRAELIYGLKRLPVSHHLQRDVVDFLSLTEVLAWPALAADVYADIRHNLKLSGQNIGDFDMMIAAHALAADAILVTNNVRHYRRIHLPLRIENWTET